MVAISTKLPNSMLFPKPFSVPAYTNPSAPIQPMNTPITFTILVFALKKMTPINKVKSGVSEFNIPVKAELITVSALVNKKAGSKFPKRPFPKNAFQLGRNSFFKCEKVNGRIKINAIKIL